MPARVIEILSAATPGTSLAPLAEATLEAGRGLVGDRYYAGVGTFSERLSGQPDAQLTLIEAEEISRFNQSAGVSLPGMVHRAGLRAQIVTGGVIRPGDAIVIAAAG